MSVQEQGVLFQNGIKEQPTKKEWEVSKAPLAISFSGGRSSAVMTKLLWDKFQGQREISITFANTGCEHSATLDFVHECERRFGWPVVWLEAVVNPRHGAGIRHKVVSYGTASRNGEPFEAVVAKYGIFNQTSPACTDRLKTNVMDSYHREVHSFEYGVNRQHYTAIGIRADESDRVSAKRREYKFVYPLADWGMRKRDIAIEMKSWGFDLQIPHDAWGNCVWCWKKTLRKHLTLAREDSRVFDFPKRMEEKYGTLKGDTAAGGPDGRRHWFRGHMDVDDIMEISRTKDFEPYTDDYWDHAKDFDENLDVGGSCGDSCEIGG